MKPGDDSSDTDSQARCSNTKQIYPSLTLVRITFMWYSRGPIWDWFPRLNFQSVTRASSEAWIPELIAAAGPEVTETYPFPSGSTINVARFCMSPVSWSVPIRISSSGLKATEWVELAGSNRKMRLLPSVPRQHFAAGLARVILTDTRSAGQRGLS
jgi:hypothetical protein